MGGKFGVKETCDVLAVGLDIGYGVGASLQNDGKINAADIVNFMPAVMDVPPAFDGSTLIPGELSELDEEDLAKIRDFVFEKGAKIPGIKESWLKIATGAFKIGSGLLDIVAATRTPTPVVS
jgi:hypothetical protein